MARSLTYVNTIVIGGGQAGLAVGYYLQKRHLPFIILDANQRIGDAWRNRWDSLRLFTPSRYALPGLGFPGRDNFPTKDQVADYLQNYAQTFRLPVRNGFRVESLQRKGSRFTIDSGPHRFESDNVVVAMANYQEPYTPGPSAFLDPGIVQLHSHAYRNPSQLQPGPVLVVGLGNSAADIAIEVARTHPTIVSGKEAGAIPWPIDTFFARNIAFRAVRFLGHHVLSVKTPIGRKARPKLLHRTTALIRVKPQDLAKAGIERVPKIMGVEDGLPLLPDGRKLDVKNVIWCTGYRSGFSWIKLPIFDELGDPMHDQGVATRFPGLYFVGLHFLYAMSSASFIGVGRDAERIVKTIARNPQPSGDCVEVDRSEPGAFDATTKPADDAASQWEVGSVSA
jgi:putative flavoprotein involved in K+ transport